MLEEENIKPHKLAYDRPSKKFRSFLAKYYGLQKYVTQNNNFVVFDDYFQAAPSKTPSSAFHPINRDTTDAFPRSVRDNEFRDFSGKT